MKKKLVALPLLSLGLLLAGCNGGNNPSTSINESESVSSNSISEVTSIENSTEVSIESDDMISLSEESSSSESSSEVSSDVKLSVKEQLIEYLNQVTTTQNYTVIHEEMTRYYLPNAYYFEDNNATPFGYAEDETGIFSYEVQNGVVSSVNYLKDENDANLTGLYEYTYGNYEWIESPNYLVNSFAPVSMNGVTLKRDKTSKVECYTVPFEKFCFLLTEGHLQSFVAATLDANMQVTKALRGTCTLSILDEGGFNVAFYSSSAWTTFNYKVVNIGATEIPEITEFIENGGVIVENLYTQIVSLFGYQRYKVTYGDGKVRYLAPNYIVDVDGENISGYFFSMTDLLTRPFVVENGEVVVQETEEVVSLYSYYIRSTFLSNFELVEDKLIEDSYLYLQSSSSYFTLGEVTEGNYIGYAEITASIAIDENGAIVPNECVVTLLGQEFDGNQGVLVDTTYTAVYSEFNTASFELLENYISSLN